MNNKNTTLSLAKIITLKWIKVGYSLKSYRIQSITLYIIHYTLCTFVQQHLSLSLYRSLHDYHTPYIFTSHITSQYTYFHFNICSFISLDFSYVCFLVFLFLFFPHFCSIFWGALDVVVFFVVFYIVDLSSFIFSKLQT